MNLGRKKFETRAFSKKKSKISLLGGNKNERIVKAILLTIGVALIITLLYYLFSWSGDITK